MRSLESFCKPSKVKYFFMLLTLSAVFSLLLVAVIYKYVKLSSDTMHWIFIAVSFGLATVLTRIVVAGENRIFDKRWEYFKQNGLTEQVLSDFGNGSAVFCGNLIIGSACMIGKGSGLIVFYSEIESVYFYPGRAASSVDNDVGDPAAVYVFCGGKKYKLCTPKVNRNSGEVENFKNFIMNKGISFETK